MFSESAWSRKTIGDVDVVYHDGLYHLFHLVLPNHDFVAHAISDNALNWRRVDNAIFIGHPGSWDDLMLWTVHVSPDPHRQGAWRMFYTGLSRRDKGLKQRIGLALSDDLFTWRKAAVNWEDHRGTNDPQAVKQARQQLPRGFSDSIQSIQDSSSCFPLEPDPQYYESSIDEERNWVSFRDPFYFRDEDANEGWLLAAARVNSGPLVRRGCVASLKEVEPNKFAAMPPLHAPLLYDDIEVPNLFRANGEYYLIGSIREDAKIRYWHTNHIDQPWRNYFDNVLLPKGNYAGRICHDDKGALLWNFFTNLADRTANNLMPPPKRLRRCSNGQLRATTFEHFETRVTDSFDCRCIRTLKPEAEEHCRVGNEGLRLTSEAGFQAYVFDHCFDSFSLKARIVMKGVGKCGLLLRIDPETHDGYYISLDLLKGIAQMRAWGTGPLRSGEEMMQFQSLQSGNWYDEDRRDVELHLLAFGSYHELSINGRVVLSLADATFESGLVGFYVETADLKIEELSLRFLQPPTQSDDHLTNG